jgi:hypothetical protein
MSVDALPDYAQEFSDQFERDLREAPRFSCDCCGHKTVLNVGYYEICPVCGWEDDRNGGARPEGAAADVHSGPNHVTLTQARKNFAEFGASTERRRDREGWLRPPRPGE